MTTLIGNLLHYEESWCKFMSFFNPYLDPFNNHLTTKMPVFDGKAYKRYPHHNFVYDKLWIVKSQGLKGGKLENLIGKETTVKYPIFIKPRWGHLSASSKNCFKVTSAKELKKYVNYKNMMWSEFIDAKEELKPDVCLYPSDFKLSLPLDLLKTNRMPLLAIEILSPRQLLEVVVSKFQAYFHLGVKSCWLVIPTQKTITIYKPNFELRVFDERDSEIVDDSLGFSVPTWPLFK
jgi:hypothetical protein